MSYNKNKAKANKVRSNAARRTRTATAIKRPLIDTLSAKEPAYLYTGLCPDAAKRVPPRLA